MPILPFDQIKTQASTTSDMLYKVEQCVENAEQHLMMAIELLHQARDLHEMALSNNADQTNPELLRHVNGRLNKTLDILKLQSVLQV